MIADERELRGRWRWVTNAWDGNLAGIVNINGRHYYAECFSNIASELDQVTPRQYRLRRVNRAWWMMKKLWWERVTLPLIYWKHRGKYAS